ncbi:MAG: alpha/beta hydrolase [Planctomycetes bacterium]|nr:alpha/beta hydrolase [Planctomycetota bacterium]
MSGAWTLPCLLERPAAAAGWVAVAPVGTDAVAARLAALELPTLVVWGARDAVLPLARGEALARALPNARLSVYPDASHPCYLDDPERFSRELIAFVREIDAAER